MEHNKLELKNALKFYVSGREITLALDYVNISFETGEFVAITGESGSGKSTMAHVLAGVLPLNQGEVLLNGQGTLQYSETEWENYRRNVISFIAQNYGVLLGNTVLDNVISGLVLAGDSKKEAGKHAKDLLQRVDLWKLRHRRAAKLSSGQKQRLSVARAVAKRAPVLIADEPTSNLDWSTAQKIIALLQEAAKDRLVIVVTHNFESMKDVATRHLIMRDGEIIGDSKTERQKLEETPVEQEVIPEKKSVRKRTAGGGYIAGLLMKARPVWSLLMFLFFSMTAFAIFVFGGSFLRVKDNKEAKMYSNEAFRNGVENRLVVQRQDSAEMSLEDYQTILSVNRIKSVERFGEICEINYHAERDEDYELVIESEGDPMFGPVIYNERIILEDSGRFMQTVPVLPEGAEFLKTGRLPKHWNEVVVTGSVKQLGQTITIYLMDWKHWSVEAFYTLEATVVGITEYGDGIYFDDRLGRMFYNANKIAKEKGGTGSLNRELWDTVYFCVDMTIPDDSNNVYVTGMHDNFYVMSEAAFDRNTKKHATNSNQVSVFIEDYSYADRVISDLEILGYEAISPYHLGSVIADNALEKERMTTLMLSLSAVLVVMVTQIAVLSSMFRLQMEDYRKLRDLGLVFNTGKHSIAAQMLCFTVFGQVVAAALLLFGAKKEIEYLVNIVKYITKENSVLLSATHLLASALTVLVVGRILQNKVFAFTVNKNELDLSELEKSGEKKGAENE